MRPAADLDLPLSLDPDGARPLHRQLADGLRTAALDGRLPAGQRLPATRLLARRLGVARTTVVAAYDQLQGEGLLTPRHGSGTYVTEHLPIPTPDPRVERRSGGGPVEPRPESRPVARSENLPGARSGGLLDLRPGRPRTGRLVDPAWTRAWRLAAREVPSWQGPPEGLDRLRAEIADHVARVRGVSVPVERVLVTAGTDDALGLLCHALRLRGREVAVEDPGYPSARRVLVRHGCTLRPVPVDDDGMVVDHVLAADRVPAAVLVTPSHQYPMGGRLPVARRVGLLEWADERGAIVLEDDYDSEFRFDVAPLPSLLALGRPGSVVHVGTFSKTLSPWLRAGYLVAPDWLTQELRAVRQDVGMPVSGVLQQALAEYLSSGALRRHVARSRRDHAHARHHLTRGLAGLTPALRVRGGDAGLHVVVELSGGLTASDVLDELARSGVRAADLAEYRVQPAPGDGPAGLVLGFGDATTGDLDRAVAALGRAVAELRSPPVARRDPQP